MNPAQSLAAEYSGKAVAYARHWAPVIRPMALPLLDALPLASARTVLDVGTGTGALIPDLQSAAPHAAIIGVDRAEGMLRAAREAGHARLAVNDAQQLGVRSGVIDVALVVFALFHIPEPVDCLREVRRVLRPGGTAGIATWGYESALPGAAVWTEELDRAGAASDPRDPRVMQQARMDTPEKLGRLMEHAGFPLVRMWSIAVVHQWTLVDLLANQVGCGAPARRLSSLSMEAQAECQSIVRERLVPLLSSQLTHRAEVLCAVAQRPA